MHTKFHRVGAVIIGYVAAALFRVVGLLVKYYIMTNNALGLSAYLA